MKAALGWFCPRAQEIGIRHLVFTFRLHGVEDESLSFEMCLCNDDANAFFSALEKSVNAGPAGVRAELAVIFFRIVGEVDETVFFRDFSAQCCLCPFLFRERNVAGGERRHNVHEESFGDGIEPGAATPGGGRWSRSP